MTTWSTTAATDESARAARIGRIRRLGRWMARGSLITCVLLVAGMVFYWAATPAPVLFGRAGLQGSAADLGIFERVVAFAISMLPLGALIFGLLSARRCFSDLAEGYIFTSRSAAGLRALALGVAASSLLQPLAGAALSVLLSWNAPGGAKTLVLNVGSDTLIGLLFAGTVAAFASILIEAVDLSDENNRFV